MGLIRSILYLSFCERYLTDLRQGLADVDLQLQLLVSDRWAADCNCVSHILIHEFFCDLIFSGK